MSSRRLWRRPVTRNRLGRVRGWLAPNLGSLDLGIVQGIGRQVRLDRLADLGLVAQVDRRDDLALCLLSQPREGEQVRLRVLDGRAPEALLHVLRDALSDLGVLLDRSL